MREKNVPKLRFKGFSDEWEEKKLGELLEFKNGVNADKDAYGKGVKFINVLDILNNNFITASKILGKVEIDKNTLEKYSVNYGDVLFQRSSETREEVGSANVYLDDETVTFGGFVIRGKKVGEYNPLFMNGLLKSSSARKEITTKAGGSTRYNVGQETLSEVTLKFPTLKEQEKIANFLNKVDKIIEKQEEKVSNLEKYKKGIMQKIFSQEIRFKKDDGGDYPEWSKKHLRDVIIKKSKGGLPQYSEDKGNVLLNNEYLEGLNLQPIYVNNKINVLEDDVLILWDGSQSGKVYTGAVGVLGSTFVSIRLNKENNNLFIYQLLNSKKNLIQTAWREGSGVPHVAKDFVENFKMKVPCLEEQIKIANYLSKIDSIVEKEKEKLEELRIWKKGLLQQMFV